MHSGINLSDDFTIFKQLFPYDMTYCFEDVVIDVKNLTAFRFFPRKLRQTQSSGFSYFSWVVAYHFSVLEHIAHLGKDW